MRMCVHTLSRQISLFCLIQFLPTQGLYNFAKVLRNPGSESKRNGINLEAEERALWNPPRNNTDILINSVKDEEVDEESVISRAIELLDSDKDEDDQD